MKLLKGLLSAQGTKRALIASAACTLLCGLLLFSTSIAWFTANKESNVNELYSGNLDVVLSYSRTMVENSWREVTDRTDDIFKVDVEDETELQNMLWEPGAVNVVYFKVENKGSLAAKYDFALVIGEETTGTNFDNHEFKLSDYIYGGVADVADVTAAYSDAVAAKTAISGKEKKLSAISGMPLITGQMSGTTENPTEKIFALVLYMPQYVVVDGEDVDVGATINYPTPDDEDDRPRVPLKVKLVATQMTGENDSFGSEYDKYAEHPDFTVENYSAFSDAIDNAKNGDVIAVRSDITLETEQTLNKNITIVGDGQSAIEKYPTYVGANNTVTFKNVKFDDTTSLEKATSVYGQGFKGTLIFDGCTFGNNNWEAIQITPAGDCTIIINNCTFNGPQGAKRFIHIQPVGNLNNNCKLNITVTNCTFNNCEKIMYNDTAANYGSVIDFDYFAPDSTITMGGNQFFNSDGSEATGIKPYFCSTGASGYPNEIEGGVLLDYLKGNIKTYEVTTTAGLQLKAN